MDTSVTLKINGDRLKNQIVVVKPDWEFEWRTPEEVDKEWFDLLLQEVIYDLRLVAFPKLATVDISLDESIVADSEEGVDAYRMAQMINILWWDAKEKDIKVAKLSSKGVNFKFKKPDFSVDEYIR